MSDGVDAALVALAGPGGSGRLDRVTGADAVEGVDGEGRRTWVDEGLASWAACLLPRAGVPLVRVGAEGAVGMGGHVPSFTGMQ